VFLEGLKPLLDRHGIDVVATASTLVRAIELAGHHRPDIAIVADSLLLQSETEMANEFRSVAPHTRLVLLGQDSLDPLQVLRDGIAGYLQNTQDPDAFVQAIHQISMGAVRWDSKRQGSASPFVHARLTDREREVLKLLAEGLSVTDAAQVLGLSAKTIAAHRTRLMAKLNIRDSATLVRYAIRSKIVDA
jgi:DNA-binding NarL/FixJ family response regulator